MFKKWIRQWRALKKVLKSCMKLRKNKDSLLFTHSSSGKKYLFKMLKNLLVICFGTENSCYWSLARPLIPPRKIHDTKVQCLAVAAEEICLAQVWREAVWLAWISYWKSMAEISLFERMATRAGWLWSGYC